jgi:hypothetical protein
MLYDEGELVNKFLANKAVNFLHIDYAIRDRAR